MEERNTRHYVIEPSQITISSSEEEEKRMILKMLSMGNDEVLASWIEKLREYTYVRSLDDLRVSQYIRYIDRRQETPQLKKGGFFHRIEYDTNKIVLYQCYRKVVRCFKVSSQYYEFFVKKTKEDCMLELFKAFLSKENS
jgi:hypothetical protein